jgi:hypothetical protein
MKLWTIEVLNELDLDHTKIRNVHNNKYEILQKRLILHECG